MKFDVPATSLPALVLCLSIGTLHAIRQGAVPAANGIWSLGAPKFWNPLQQTGLLPDEIIQVLQATDALDALQQLAPEHFDDAVQTLVDRLLTALAKQPDTVWSGTWETEITS